MQPTQSPSPQASYIPSQSPPEQYHQQYHQQQQQQTHLLHHQLQQTQQQQQPPQQAVGGQQPAVYITPNYQISDGYVAAPSAGFSAPSGPPHQGLRGMQTAAPPTPPQQQELTKMQQSQSMFVPNGGGNGGGSVRPNQQGNMYRGASSAPSQRTPRPNITMQSPLYISNTPQVVLPPASFHAFGGRQQSSYLHFPATQMPGFPQIQYYVPTGPLLAQPTHRAGSVPNAMVQNPGAAGMQTVGGVGQNPMTMPACGLTPTGHGAGGSSAGSGVSLSCGTGTLTGGTKKQRTHAIPIIDPVTLKNILENDGQTKSQGSNSTSSETEYQEQQQQPPQPPQQHQQHHQQQHSLPNSMDVNESTNNPQQDQQNPASVEKGIQQTNYMDMIPHKIGAIPSVQNQGTTTTPVVSAMSDGPSVEIHPKQQHLKSKKIKTTESFTQATTTAPPTIQAQIFSDKSSDKDSASPSSVKAATSSIDTLELADESTQVTSSNVPHSNIVKTADDIPNISKTISSDTDNIDDSRTIDAISSSKEPTNSLPIPPGKQLQQQVSAAIRKQQLTGSATSAPQQHSASLGSSNNSSSQASKAATSISSTPTSSTPSTPHHVAGDNSKKSGQVGTINSNHMPAKQSKTKDSKGHSTSNPNNTASASSAVSSQEIKAATQQQQNAANNNTATDSGSQVTSNNQRQQSQIDDTMTLNEKEEQTNSSSKVGSNTTSTAADTGNIQNNTALETNADRKEVISKKVTSDKNENIIKTQQKSKQSSVDNSSPASVISNNNTSTSSTMTTTNTDSKPDHHSLDETDKAVTTKIANSELLNNNNNVELIEKTTKLDNNAILPPSNVISQSEEQAIEGVITADGVQPSAATATAEKKTSDPTSTATEDKPSDATVANASVGAKIPQSLIQYNEGQWSPDNPDGNKTYNRSQLLILRDSPASKAPPEVNNKVTAILINNNHNQQQHSLLPSFVYNTNKRPNMGGSVQIGRAMSSSSGSNQYLKQTSMSGVNAKSSSKGSKSYIHLSLSLREDVKLNETENAWRPTRLRGSADTPPDVRAKEDLLRSVRGILNKLTPEKFDILVDHIMKLQMDTPEKITSVMELVFEKAIDEPNFSSSYAKLCLRLAENKLQSVRRDETKSLAEQKQSNLVTFKNALLDKTQREFHDNVLERHAKENKLKPTIEKIKECTDPEKKLELQATLEEEERKIRRRSGGTVRFIGELFKIAMLTPPIIWGCINNLLDPNYEDKLECLCKLLPTVGKQMEESLIKDTVSECYNLDEIMKKMQMIANKKTETKISSRVRFMLQDVIDLRKNKWISKRSEVPKTMEQIQKEAETEHLNNQYYNMMNKKEDNNRRYGGSGNLGGMSSGGGGNIGGNSGYNKGSRQQSDGDTWYTQTPKGNRAVDANKLNHMINCGNENPTKLGASSQFQWNRGGGGAGSSDKPMTTTSNSFAPLSGLDSNKGSTGFRSKGLFSKSSLERERHDGQHSRTGSAHGSRENSSSRNTSARGASNQSRGTSNMYGGSSGATSTQSTPRSSKPTPVGTMSNILQQPALQPYPDDHKTVNRLIKDMVTKVFEEIIHECPDDMRRFPEESRWKFYYQILCDYLHLAEITPAHRRNLSKVFALFFSRKLTNVEQFRKGYAGYLELAEEIIIDVPEAWSYIFEFVGPLVYKNYIPVKELMNDSLTMDLKKKFIKELIVYCTKELGPNFTCTMWRNSGWKWTDFVPESEVEKFIKDCNFGFIESTNSTTPIPIFGTTDISKVIDRVTNLLEEDSSKDSIMDYINGNVRVIDKQFIRELTTTLCKNAILHENNNYKLNKNKFQEVCIPVLQRYVDSKDERELECLYAIQLLINKLEHPSGVLSELFGELYDSDTIPQDTFMKWRDSKEEPTGKGVAVKGLNQFFNDIINSETSDENN